MANYINKLQGDVAELKGKLSGAEEALHELRCYLDSPKFRCGDSLDGYVHVRDVMDRIRLVHDALA